MAAAASANWQQRPTPTGLARSPPPVTGDPPVLPVGVARSPVATGAGPLTALARPPLGGQAALIRGIAPFTQPQAA